jgi:hypothetical protein
MHDDNPSESTKACTDISEIRNKKNKKQKNEDARMDIRVQFKFRTSNRVSKHPVLGEGR